MTERTVRQPLVAIVSAVPLVAVELAAALDGIADVRTFTANRGDTAGLLRSLLPDVVVVDSDGEIAAAEAFARESGRPVVHMALRAGVLRVLRDGTWEQPRGSAATAEAVRNVVIGAVFARERVPQ